MTQYVIKRLALMVVTLFGITVLTFLLTRLTPGDPAALKVQGAGGGGASAGAGAFQDMVELNRRNLGLDKPLLFNLRPMTPTEQAHRAIDDLFREADYWTRDGEKRLQRQSSLALGPALERYAAIGSEGERLPRAPDGGPAQVAPDNERRRRLARVLPSLAGGGVAGGGTDEDVYTRVHEWHQVQRLDAGEVRRRVDNYMAQTEFPGPKLGPLVEVGGHAVPRLVARLSHAESTKRWGAVVALQRITGLTFAQSPAEFQEREVEVLQRWHSWWRRERSSYVAPTTAGRIVGVIADTQFGLWARQVATLDFGDSYSTKRPVMRMLREALPISILLSSLSILIGYLIAIPVGVFSAAQRHTAADSVITVILFVLYSLPSFWVAGLLLLTTTGAPFFDWFPTRGLHTEGLEFGAAGVSTARSLADLAWHLVLPVTCLTYGSLAFVSRQVRSAMLESLHQDYIRTARAKGVREFVVVYRHALRNSLIPLLTISAGLLPELIAGAVIIESIFNIPGMGMLTLEAIIQRDYPVVNAVLFISAALTLVGILLVDLAYALVDPRITYE